MPFAWFVALRYLRDAQGQTLLILGAVSVGVSVIVFLSALINGLQDSLIESTLGSQPHVTIRVPREAPRPLAEPREGVVMARIVQPSAQRVRSIDQWPRVLTDVERTAGITAAAATVTGSGVAIRGDARVPVVIRGVEIERFGEIVDLRSRLVEGTLQLAGGNVAIGSGLAADLGVGTDDKLRLSSNEGVDDVVTVSGIFTLGNDAVDSSWVVTSLSHAQSLFALPGGATTVELQVSEIFDAERIAAELRGRIDLNAESWMTLNAELLQGLEAQSSSKTMIQFFVVMSVTLGIASVLIVTVVQKSREIGILRAVGTPARRLLAVFLIQGGLLGFGGSLIGSFLGVVFAKAFEVMTAGPDGLPRFPVAVDLELLVNATLLATGVGLLAAVIPARRASRLDPATAIRNG